MVSISYNNHSYHYFSLRDTLRIGGITVMRNDGTIFDGTPEERRQRAAWVPVIQALIVLIILICLLDCASVVDSGRYTHPRCDMLIIR